MSTSLNRSAAIALVSPDVRAVQCTFAGDGRRYTFKAHDKMLDRPLKEGDRVVVPNANAANSFKVVTVVGFDDDFEFENSGIDYKWIVCRVPTEALERVATAEKVATDQLRQADRERCRRVALEAMFGAGAKEQADRIAFDPTADVEAVAEKET